MLFLKIWWHVLLFIGCCTGSGDVNERKLNMVGFTSTPAVGPHSDANIRGYTMDPDKSKNITLSITLLQNGSVTGQPLCGLGDKVTCRVRNVGQGSATSFYREALISNSTADDAGVGQFTVYANKSSRNATATIIVHNSMADVIPIVRTKTVSMGDCNVTLGVVLREATACTGTGALRWEKDGIRMDNWNNESEILFENISSADDGIYECYKQNEQNERIKHAFMQLIVRECPHNKWSPPDCTKDCEVCYNGGVCDTYIGTCICPSGFYGRRCEKSAGDNRFGRDGRIPCSSYVGGSCIGNLFCPPLPQGCACHAGWKGLDCRTKCGGFKYGADCLQDCHCDAAECDRSRGCNVNATCHPGYVGERCLVKNITENSSHTTSGASTTNGNVLSVKLTWTYN